MPGEVRESGLLVLPCVPASVPVARHRLTADLLAAGIFDPAVGDAALVVSELLSNAIRHARPMPGAILQVRWMLGSGSVEVAVSDGGALTLPHNSRPPVSATSGRGLGIVEHLSCTWGIQSDDLGLMVWAVVPAPQRPGTSLAS